MTIEHYKPKLFYTFIEKMMHKPNKWEHFSHGADIGIRGIGETITKAFEMGALALTAVITDLNSLHANSQRKICCEAPDNEILFMDWINAIIYEIETQDMLFCEYQVEINGNKLNAMLKGEKMNRLKHQPVVDVKGATFTELKVYQQKNTWIAQCVVDV